MQKDTENCLNYSYLFENLPILYDSKAQMNNMSLMSISPNVGHQIVSSEALSI